MDDMFPTRGLETHMLKCGKVLHSAGLYKNSSVSHWGGLKHTHPTRVKSNTPPCFLRMFGAPHGDLTHTCSNRLKSNSVCCFPPRGGGLETQTNKYSKS